MNMDQRGTTPADEMRIRGANRNFRGRFAPPSIGLGTLEGENLAPLTENLNSDTSDDELPDLEVEDQGNHRGGDEVADHSADNFPRRRRRNHRHTQHQITEMETFFKRYPRPNKNQRQDLARRLGLDPLQVKFWFQNRRTQMKTQHDRKENSKLRAENEKLHNENMKLKQNTFVISCQNCGNPRVVTMSTEQRLLSLENAQLTKEIERVTAMTKNVFGNNSQPSAGSFTPSLLGAYGGGLPANIPSQEVVGGSTQPFYPPYGPGELNKSLITEIATMAMRELTAMARIAEPLWMPNPGYDGVVLNEQEYFKIFRRGFSQKPPGYKSEASRGTAIVIIDSANIPEMFMDLNKWMAMFSGMISRAVLLEVLSPGVEGGNYDGAMQVMSAEFQVLSPAVPTRECTFVRYCKQVSEGTWAVVDVSVDALFRKRPVTSCQKRPSGCIIQELPNGYSKIIWVEHVDVQDQMIHNLSKSIISSGYAYGAKRWISILERQCERIASATGQTNYAYYGYLNGIALSSPEGRQSILKLAERMILSFCGGVTAPFSGYPWTIISGDGFDEVRIMTRKSVDDPGRPGGVVISAAICFWIPVPSKNVFSYLRNEKTRVEWDVLTNGEGVQEMACISNGKGTGNTVSVLRVTNRHANQGNMLILQESSSEATSSFIVYAPVDVLSIGTMFRGGNSDEVQLLPSGFTILPSGPPDCDGRINDDSILKGTLLTVSFQILVDAGPYAKLSVSAVTMVSNLVESTAKKIKVALGVD